jgi:hypothetical protein
MIRYTSIAVSGLLGSMPPHTKVGFSGKNLPDVAERARSLREKALLRVLDAVVSALAYIAWRCYVGRDEQPK